MLHWCHKCDHAHSRTRTVTVADGDPIPIPDELLCAEEGCDCGWWMRRTPHDEVNKKYLNKLPRKEFLDYSGCPYGDRSMRAVILHRARDARAYPRCSSNFEGELGKKLIDELAEEARQEGLRRGFPGDLAELGRVQNRETLLLHLTRAETYGSVWDYCLPNAPCDICQRILDGTLVWWP